MRTLSVRVALPSSASVLLTVLLHCCSAARVCCMVCGVGNDGSSARIVRQLRFLRIFKLNRLLRLSKLSKYFKYIEMISARGRHLSPWPRRCHVAVATWHASVCRS